MSLSEVTDKAKLYLENAYGILKSKGAKIPKYKNFANLAGCADTISYGLYEFPPDAGDLTGIQITKKPIKLYYKEGDSIDVAGLEVTAVYENNITEDVTERCSIIIENPLTVYDKYVTIRYGGYEVTYDITVYSEPEEIPDDPVYLYHFNGNKINEITQTEMTNTGIWYPAAGKFNQGATSFTEQLNSIPSLSDLLRYNYQYTFSFWLYFVETGMYGDGRNYTYPFHYGTTNGSYWSNPRWFIQLRTENSIQLSGPGFGSTYTSDTSLLRKWLHIGVTFNNGTVTWYLNGKKMSSNYAGISSALSSDGKYLSINSKWVYIDELLITRGILWNSDFEPQKNEYSGKRILHKIYIEQPPKTTYLAGERFDFSNAIIKAVYSDSTILNVTDECTVVEGSLVSATDRFKTIKYTYEGVSKTVRVNVSAYTLEPSLHARNTRMLIPFDGNAVDLMGNELEVVGNNNFSAYEDGMFSESKYFDGITDYLATLYKNDINIDTGDFTIAFWIKPKASAATRILWSLFSGAYGSRIYLSGGNLVCARFATDANDTCVVLQDTTAVINNAWTHIAVTRNGDLFSLYVDGRLVASTTSSLDLVNGNHMHFGTWTQNGAFTYFYPGYMDDFILTKSVLWTEEFTPPTAPYAENLTTDEEYLLELNDGGGIIWQ